MPSIEQRIRSQLDQARSERRAGREKLAALAAEQDVIKTRGVELSIQIKLLKGLIESEALENSGERGGGTDQPPPWTADQLRRLSTMEVIESTLAAHPKPMRVIDMVRQAIKWGYDKPDSDEDRVFAVFSSALVRGCEGPAPKFEKISRGVFKLAGRPRPVIVDMDGEFGEPGEIYQTVPAEKGS